MLSFRGILTTSGLVLLLCLTGCNKDRGNPGQAGTPPVSAPTVPPPAPGAPLIAPVGNTGAGVMASLSSGNRVMWENHLRNIHLAYQDKTDQGSPPKSADDLGTGITSQQRQMLQPGGNLIIRWGLNPNNAPAGASNTVLGYVKDVPTNGGIVLMLNGSLSNMSKDEFAKAIKVGQ